MKLADRIKPGVAAEIDLVDGAAVILGGSGETHKLEKVDDAEQVLVLLTLIASGRRKGQKARAIIPYSAIRQVVVPL